jgi:hypothetical protein
LTEYSDDYQHFDRMIWQVPAWCSAVYAFIITTLIGLIKDKCANSHNLPQEGLLTIAVIVGFAFLLTIFSFSYILYRFRCNQKKVTRHQPVPGKLFKKFGGQTVMQFTISFQFASILALILYLLDWCTAAVIGLPFATALIMSGVYENEVDRVPGS